MRKQLLIAVLIISLAQAAVSSAAESAKHQVEMNAIAHQAFQVVNDVPVKGLDQSVIGIEQIIATHRRLAKSEDPTQQYLSVVLADSVAYAIVHEIHRANLSRRGIMQKVVPTAIPFDKRTAIRLCRVNAPEFGPLIRKALNGNDKLLDYIAKQSSEEEVLDGRMLDKIPVGSISDYEQELSQRAQVPVLNLTNITPDMHLMYLLNKFQIFRDLTIIMDQYEKKDLPEDHKAFRAMFEGVMSNYPSRRVDDGMKATPFKVWMTYDHYGIEGSVGSSSSPDEEYTIRQTFALLPFMTDTSSLPEPSQKMLKQLRKMEQKAAAKKKTNEMKRNTPAQ